MKNIFKNGLFAVLVILLVGIVCIPENSSDSVSGDLSNQITTEQSVDLNSVDDATEAPATSNELSERNYLSIEYLAYSVSVEKLNQNDFSANPATVDYAGLKDETLSSEYWSETNLLVPLHRQSVYFT